MLAEPTTQGFRAQLAELLARLDADSMPVPRKLEVALTGADPDRFVIDTRQGRLEERGAMAPPLAVHVPRRVFEDLVGAPANAWLAAYDKGLIELVGEPTKVEMVQVYVERVLRPML